MSWVEAIVEAFRLFVLTVSYAIEQAKRQQAKVDDATAKRALFEAAVMRALTEMRTRAGDEKRQVDAVDDEIEKK